MDSTDTIVFSTQPAPELTLTCPYKEGKYNISQCIYYINNKFFHAEETLGRIGLDLFVIGFVLGIWIAVAIRKWRR